MKFARLFIPAAFALALVSPLASGAQTQNPPTQAATPQSANPPHSEHAHGMMRAINELNLSDQQRSQIQQIREQYRQAHPKGSAADPQGRKDMRDKIFATLTPDQQAQLKQRLAQMRAERQQRPQPGGANPPSTAGTPAPISTP